MRETFAKHGMQWVIGAALIGAKQMIDDGDDHIDVVMSAIHEAIENLETDGGDADSAKQLFAAVFGLYLMSQVDDDVKH